MSSWGEIRNKLENSAKQVTCNVYTKVKMYLLNCMSS